jgi:hypothetical protein
MKLHAKVSDCKVARRTLHQPDAQPFLERAYASANARSGYTQGFGSAGESVVVHYLGKDVEIVQVLHVCNSLQRRY